MVKMIATKPITYGRQVLAAGDAFEADARYAPVLVQLGRARPADAPSTASKPTGTRAEVEPPADEQPSKGKTYGTRRLKAED